MIECDIQFNSYIIEYQFLGHQLFDYFYVLPLDINFILLKKCYLSLLFNLIYLLQVIHNDVLSSDFVPLTSVFKSPTF